MRDGRHFFAAIFRKTFEERADAPQKPRYDPTSSFPSQLLYPNHRKALFFYWWKAAQHLFLCFFFWNVLWDTFVKGSKQHCWTVNITMRRVRLVVVFSGNFMKFRYKLSHIWAHPSFKGVFFFTFERFYGLFPLPWAFHRCLSTFYKYVYCSLLVEREVLVYIPDSLPSRLVAYYSSRFLHDPHPHSSTSELVSRAKQVSFVAGNFHTSMNQVKACA